MMRPATLTLAALAITASKWQHSGIAFESCGKLCFANAFSPAHLSRMQQPVDCKRRNNFQMEGRPFSQWAPATRGRGGFERLDRNFEPRSTSLASSVLSEVNATDATDAVDITSSVADNGKTGNQRSSNNEPNNSNDPDALNVVLVTGFESFNRELYEKAGALLPKECKINLKVFADSDIRTTFTNQVADQTEDDQTDHNINKQFAEAVKNADAFIGSLIFDYDDVVAVSKLLHHVRGPRLLFECATELMSFNRVGTFTMESSDDGPSGPPPAIKAILNKFSSGKEEDKINGYLTPIRLTGPDLDRLELTGPDLDQLEKFLQFEHVPVVLEPWKVAQSIQRDLYCTRNIFDHTIRPVVD